MYCPNCGTAAAVGQKFCSKCGGSLEVSSGPSRSAPFAATAPTAHEEFPYSGFWRRAFGWLVDCVVLYLALVVLGAIVGVLVRAVTGKSAGLALREVAVVGTLFLPWLYYAVMESSALQATVGKLAAGIKVTDLAGNRVTFGRATGRYFAHILSGISLGVGYAMVVFTSQRQALHDMVAGTLVVRRASSPQSIAAAGPAPRVSPALATLAVVGVLLFGPFGIGVIAAIAIPAYQDYTIRAQVTEGLNAAAPYKLAVSESATQGQPFAALTSEQLQLPETGRWHYVASIKVVSGIVAVTYGGSANKLIAGKTVLLVPATTDGGQQIVWTCGHHAPPDGSAPVTHEDLSAYTTVADKYLPLACRT